MKSKNKVSYHVRQGDVFLERVSDIPSGAKPIKRVNGRVILAYGEVTGHHHSLLEDHCSLFSSPTETGVTYLEIKEAMAALTHQEHSTINLEPGVYRVSIQREYSPQEIRDVLD